MIKAMAHLPYTSYRDFVAESSDFESLPLDCGDGSTCVMSDTGKEYVFHKQEKTWREEKRPIPELAYRGEADSMVYWNGVKWKALEEEKEN